MATLNLVENVSASTRLKASVFRKLHLKESVAASTYLYVRQRDWRNRP